MRKILTIGAAAIAVLLVAILSFAATKPDSFRVERSVSIKAPPEKVVALIDDFHQWSLWSPWERLDPAMQRTFSGATSGTGAAYTWTGNRKVGAGHMEVLDASPSKVTIKLDFLKPFEGHNTAEFTLQPNGDSTRVTWAMYGPSPYMSKVMGTIFNMDKMIGKDFSTGLANMKRVAER
jgi:carbon monoxide dehydrogenase subunit G